MKMVLSILTIFCLFVLVYFTFFAPNYLWNINTYNLLSPGLYSIWENSILSPEVQTGSIKVQKLNNANNIYFKDGNLDIQDGNISLSWGIYLVEFNEVQTQYKIISDDFEIQNDGPGSFIINNTDPKVFNIFSISGKVNVIPKHSRIPEDKQVHIQVYPNMYFITNRNRAISYNNVDLNRVQQLSQYNAISWEIYFHPILLSEDGKPQQDSDGNIINDMDKYVLKSEIKSKIFNNNSDYDFFIKDVYDYKKQNLEKQNEVFDRISEKQFYNFPGEDYISMYFDFFLNDQKKKYYYKNLILKKLILISNSESQESDITFIIEKLDELKAVSQKEYENMLDVIQYYYENILYTQKDNTNVIVNIDKLYSQSHKQNKDFNFHSLVNLNYVYENKILWVPDFFNKNVSVFMELYSKELLLSDQDKLQEKYSYYIYFVKNLILNESKDVGDYNNFVKIFQQYVNVFNQYIVNANAKEIETQIFNNSQLIDVFIEIMREVFFEEQRNDRQLLEQKTNTKIDYSQYLILKENLQVLVKFFENNKSVINSKATNGSKEEILLEKYANNIDILEEYFLAMDNYPEYELKYDKAVIDIEFGSQDDQLSIAKAKKYLYQFQWSVTETADIEIRNFGFCMNPENYTPWAQVDNDPYCYQIKRIEIDGMIFSFLLNPNKQNEISYLSYINKQWETVETTSSHIMDKIKEKYEIEYKRSQSEERDKYDFSKFFTNNYAQRTQVVNNNQQEESIDKTPPIVEESIWVEILKRWLIWEDAPLKDIKSVLPISYRYLLVERENNQYIVNVFPTDFSVENPDANNYDDKNFQWKFSWRYIYDTPNHYFTNVKIQPIDDDNRRGRSFIFDNSVIQLNWNLYFEELEKVLIELAKKQNMLEYFYKEILANYPDTQSINMYYDIESKMITLEYTNKKVEINDNGQANIFQNGRKIIGPVRYSTIDL